MRSRGASLGALFLALSPLAARASAPIAIVGARIESGAGPAIEEGLVLIEGERIRYAGPLRPVPPGAEVVDARGKIVTPGLIDAVTQLGAVEVSLEGTTRDHELEGDDPIRAALYLGDAIDLDSSLIGVARRHGVTAALAAPTGGLVSGRSALVELVDLGAEASAFAALQRRSVQGPMAVHVTLGARGARAVGGSRAEALRRLRELLEDTRVYARNRDAFERNAFRRLAAHRLELEALRPAVEGKLPLFVSVARAADILAVLELAESERLRIVIVGGEEAWRVAPALAAAQVPVIVHPLDNLPADFEGRAARQDAAARLAAAGVRVSISTFSSHNAGGLRFLLGNAVRAGLSPERALAAATAEPARLLGLERELGTLAPGLRANLVVWTGDPFEPAHHAERVMIRGAWQDTESRQTRLRTRHQRRLGL